MKFTSQLKLNSVPDWTDQYIAYSHLKKIIYSIELNESKRTYNHFDEDSPLLPPPSSSSNSSSSHHSFINALDIELDCIVHFYLRTEKSLFDLSDKFLSDLHYAESTYLSKSNQPSTINTPTHFHNNTSRFSPLRPISKRTLLSDNLNLLESQPITSLSTAPLILSPNASPCHYRSPSKSISAYDSDPGDTNSSHTMRPLSASTVIPPSNSQEQSISNQLTSSSPMTPHSTSNAIIPCTPTRPSVANTHLFSTSNTHIWNTQSMKSDRDRLSSRAIELYASLHDLHDYVLLNHTGFSKILKKYNKVTNSRIAYLSKVDQAYPFIQETRNRLENAITQVETLYAHLHENAPSCLAELKTNLRQHVTFERNTVWRDMVSQERQTQAIRPVPVASNTYLVLKWNDRVSISIPRLTFRFVNIAIGVIIMSTLLTVQLFDTYEQQSCFAILMTASWLWMTEAIPLFVTGLLVPLFVVLLSVLRDPISLVTLNPHAATKFIFSAMFSPVIMLLLGGFSIAAALSKHFIAKVFAVSLLTKAGNKTVWVLLANMMVATFVSMWISNVAAPVLCFSIIQPILRTLPSNSSFGPALILGIALASNIGGMASPISSPQNVVALENMVNQPSWLDWFMITIPICIVTNIITWLILLLAYKPHINTPEIVPLRHTEENLTIKQWFILTVTVFTIFLWCIESLIEPWIGDMGIIAIFPIIVFFGSGILTKDDWNNFLWTVIILAMGGIALGKAVDNSGLLQIIASTIKVFVHGMSAWSVLLTFTCLMLVVATFISHTVAALILLPIVAEVGNQMPDPHPRLLVMGGALMCSGAMGLPISGFPNMNAISQEDATGKPYLQSWDFIKCGVPGSIGVALAILTIGYGTMGFLAY